MSNRQDQERRTIRSARDRAEKHTSGFASTSLILPEGVKLFKPEKGVMLLDIIPYVVGKGNPFADKGEVHYERTFFVHRGVGPSGDSYVCLKKTTNERCPICEYRAKIAKDPDADEQLVKDMAPRERQLFNVINRKDRDAGIQLWDVSYHLFGKQLDGRISSDAADESWAMFHSPTEGLTLIVDFKEKTFGGNTFVEAATIDFKPRKEPYKESIIDKALCLDKLVKIDEFDKLKAVLLQTEDEKPKGGKGDDDDDKPRRSRDDDDDKPKRSSSDDDDDKPKRSSSDDDDDKPKRSNKDDDDDRPKRRDADDDDDKPKRRDSDDEDKPKPKAGRFVDDDDDKPKKPKDDDDDRPKRSRDDDDDKPKRRDDDDEKPRRRDDDDDKPKKPSRDDDDKPKGKKDDDDIPWDDDDKPKKPKRDDD